MKLNDLSVVVYLMFMVVTVMSFNSCHEVKGLGINHDPNALVWKPVDTVFNKMWENQITENIDKYQCPGMAIAVIKDNQIIFEKEYGVRSIQNEASIDLNTLFRIGSLSKGFAGILAAKLIEKNKFKLDDPVSMYIPEFTVKAKNKDGIMRIQHILSHTSGFTEHAFSNLVDENVNREVMIRYLDNLVPKDSTGKVYAYQNVAFSLIEKVIEKVTGMTYTEALDSYILSPLNMCNTSCTYESMESVANRCEGHGYTRYGYASKELGRQYYNIPSAGGINAPLKDMEKWLSAVMGNNPDVISKEAQNIAFSSYANTSYDRKFWNKKSDVMHTNYGLGWRLITTPQNQLVYHGGLVNGFRAEIAFDQKTKTGIVVLFNSVCNYSNRIVFDFYDLWNNYHNDNQEIYL